MYSKYSKSYLEKGISVIPSAGKKVCTRNFAQYAHRLPNEAELAFFEANFPRHNIALMMGPVNNLMCIDIDTNDEDVLEFVLNECGPTVAKFGSKGISYIYRTTDTYKNKMFVALGRGCLLEFLCNGRFTVIPPSRHPNGNLYIWKPLPFLEYGQIPEIAEESLIRIEEYLRTKHECLELKEVLKLKAAA